MAVTIYALCDDSFVRYIGASSNVRQRLASHMSKAGKYRANVSQWLATLKAKDQKPTLRILETVSDQDDWEERERHWITVYAGPSLLNQTTGGAGTPGFSWTDEEKAAIGRRTKQTHTGMKRSPEARERQRIAQQRIVAALAAQGKKKTHAPPTDETRAKIAAAMRGKKHTEESKKKMSEQRQNPSAELRAKWAIAARNRDPEWITWFAQQQKGKPKSEEKKAKMSATAKARWARKKQNGQNS